jgi:hypothetical protein
VKISCTALNLTLPWEKERLFLLRTTDALRLCHGGGFEEMSSSRAVESIRRIVRRDMFDVRRFVAQVGICPPGVANFDDARLLALLQAKVQIRELAVVRGAAAGLAGASSRQADQRRVLSRIEALSRPPMSHGGRQYRLVLDVQLAQLADRNNYEVVRHEDAVTILRGLVQENAAGSDLTGRLTEAIEMLSKDWRPPLSPDGLILLRRLRRSASPRPDDGAALTPSQLKKMTEKDWLEIELVDEDGQPCAAHYRLELEGSIVSESDFPEDGVVGLYNIEPGTYELNLGEVKLVAADAAEGGGGKRRDGG